jgi:hypothetical protein
MKKTIFLSTIFAMMALFSMAQAPVLLPLGIDTNLITAHSITASATKLSGSGQWHAKIQVKASGTSMWLNSDTETFGNGVTIITIDKDSLVANTQYLVRFISYNTAFTDSAISTIQTVWTKQLPQPVSITSATSVSMLPKSGIIFTASAVEQSAFGFGIDYFTSARVTDTVFFIGNVTDTVLFLVGGPSYAHNQTIFIVKALDGSSVDYSSVIPAFADPNYTAPHATSGMVYKNQDSVRVTVNVTSLGNAGNATMVVIIKDTLGPIVLQTVQAITSTGSFDFSKGQLKTNHWYNIFVSTLNQFGMGDTLRYSVKTDNVNDPSGTLAVGAVGYTAYTVSTTSATNGTGDSSSIKAVYYYEDGVIVDSSTSSSPSFTRTGRTQGHTYYGKVKLVNMANLSYTTPQIPITMLTLASNQEPTIDDLFADGPFDLRVSLITYGASPGNTSTPRLMCRDMMTGYVDTATVATGLIGTGSISEYVFTNRIANHSYQVTVFDDSPAGRVWGNTLQKTMPAPADPVLAGIVQLQVSTTATTLGIHVFGSGEGNDSPILKLWLYQNNVQIGSVFSTVVNSGMFDYEYVWDNLQPSTNYKVVAEISATGSATSSTFGFFYTDAMSGLSEIPQITETQAVRVCNIMGQVVAQGEYQTICASLAGSQACLFVTPLGSDGLPSGSTRKLFFQ